MLLWFSQEASHFIDAVFQADRDVRDLVRARDTYINGPLATFYRSEQGQNCCTTNYLKFGYANPTQLFSPSNVPPTLLPHDVERWARVTDLTAAQANSEAGPRGMGDYIAARPEFAPSFVETVAESFLGRELNEEDAALRTQLQSALTGATFKPRAMIRRLLLSDAYRRANNLLSTAWREGAMR
jgi:hypothetical protein